MGLMKDRLRSFMSGRYGVDALSKLLMCVAVICALLALFFGKLFYLLGLCILGYVYFRMFSTSYEKRYREYRAYVNGKNRVLSFFRRQKNIMEQRKTYHIYTCSQCRQMIRIPKGHGRIIVTCPKCKFEFEKNS